jgi:hypothetical protein
VDGEPLLVGEHLVRDLLLALTAGNAVCENADTRCSSEDEHRASA